MDVIKRNWKNITIFATFRNFRNAPTFCLGCVFVSLPPSSYEQSSNTNLNQFKGSLDTLIFLSVITTCLNNDEMNDTTTVHRNNLKNQILDFPVYELPTYGFTHLLRIFDNATQGLTTL